MNQLLTLYYSHWCFYPKRLKWSTTELYFIQEPKDEKQKEKLVKLISYKMVTHFKTQQTLMWFILMWFIFPVHHSICRKLRNRVLQLLFWKAQSRRFIVSAAAVVLLDRGSSRFLQRPAPPAPPAPPPAQQLLRWSTISEDNNTTAITSEVQLLLFFTCGTKLQKLQEKVKLQRNIKYSEGPTVENQEFPMRY